MNKYSLAGIIFAIFITGVVSGFLIHKYIISKKKDEDFVFLSSAIRPAITRVPGVSIYGYGQDKIIETSFPNDEHYCKER